MATTDTETQIRVIAVKNRFCAGNGDGNVNGDAKRGEIGEEPSVRGDTNMSCSSGEQSVLRRRIRRRRLQDELHRQITEYHIGREQSIADNG